VGVKGKKQPLFCHFNKKTTTVFLSSGAKTQKKNNNQKQFSTVDA